ncbi:NADH dehydrogenase FAD-containing subunit [Halobacteriales archaeon QS_4_69_34]|nr:MAG: NADH dehydrogenase FAD-containing subunit [Halobacteriales archaeon QS_4_69_34]
MKVAVLGAGYAGLTLARRLERKLPAGVEIVLVNDSPAHLVQHELHRVVRRPSLADGITVELAAVLDRAVVREAVVTDVDHEARTVELESGASIGYDVGAVCLGAETAFYGLPGVEEHGTPLKRLPDAARIREDFLRLLGSGGPDGPDGSGRSSGWRGRVVVGGAGLSGVQVAGELAALAREEGSREAIEVVLLEQAGSVAPNFPENFQAAVRAELDDSGIEVRTGTAVERATAETIVLAGGEELGYGQFVWTGGIRGPDALGGERPTVGNALQLDDRTFVVGDAARVVDADGAAVPASAAAAIREARTVAESIAGIVEHELATGRDGAGGERGERCRGGRTSGEDVFGPRPEPFRFDAPGWLVSVGDGAVAQVGPSVVRGTAAKALKTSVGAGYLGLVGAIRNAADLVNEELAADDRADG